MRVVQVGYGYWGANIARNLTASGKLELVAVCEIDSGRRQKAAEALPSRTIISDDYVSFLVDADVDAYIIATQTENSFEIAMKALDAGKHIFIEKPIATSVRRAEILKAKAEAKGLILHCDHIMVYNPVVRYIKRMYNNGELGKLQYFDVSRLNLGPIRKDVNAMLDLAVHDLAVIDYISDGKEPISISAMGGTPFGHQETLTYLTLQYEGFVAHIKSSWISPIKERRTMIGGSEKMVIFDDMKNSEKLTVYNCGIDVRQGEEYGAYEFLSCVGDIYIPYIPFEDSLKNSLEWFASSVAENTPLLSGPGQSLRVMRILEQAQQQLKEGFES